MFEGLMQCDCCDYFTIPMGDDYEICPICFWEQDAFGIAEPSEPSNANHGITLSQGRANFLALGACTERFFRNVIAGAERVKYRHLDRTIL